MKESILGRPSSCKGNGVSDVMGERERRRLNSRRDGGREEGREDRKR